MLRIPSSAIARTDIVPDAGRIKASARVAIAVSAFAEQAVGSGCACDSIMNTRLAHALA